MAWPNREFSRGAFLHNPRGTLEVVFLWHVPWRPSPLTRVAGKNCQSLDRVLGDLQSWNNLHLSKGGNRDFASLSMNWLLERDTLMGGLGAKAHSGISHGYSRTNLETAPMGVTADPALGSLCCWLPDLAERRY